MKLEIFDQLASIIIMSYASLKIDSNVYNILSY